MTCVLGMVVRREREIRELLEDSVLPCHQYRRSEWAEAGRRMEGSRRFKVLCVSASLQGKWIQEKRNRGGTDPLSERGRAVYVSDRIH